MSTRLADQDAPDSDVDVVVIGGGPGEPDSGLAQLGDVLLSRMREQATGFGARIVPETVHRLAREADGCFTSETASGTVRSRMVLLAAGCVDREPELPDTPEATRNGLMRYRPICDAYEVTGQKVAIIGYGACSLREASLLRGYTDDMTLLTLGRQFEFSAEDRDGLREAGVRVIEDPVRRLALADGAIEAWHMDSGEAHWFDAVYSALGRLVRSELAQALSAEADAEQGNRSWL